MGNAQERVNALVNKLLAMDFAPDHIVYSTALDSCAVAGAGEAAATLLKRANAAGVQPDLAAYAAAISACIPDARVDLALAVLETMREQNVQPNAVTINCALSVCAAKGDARRALLIFHSMKSMWGLQPDSIGYTIMVEVLGKAQRYADALAFMVVSECIGVSAYEWQGLRVLADTMPPKTQLNLHGLSTTAASVALRAWLLCLRRALGKGKLLREEPSGNFGFSNFCIVTGRGKNSVSGVAKIRPVVRDLLNGGLGPPVAYVLSNNNGALTIEAGAMKRFLRHPNLKLGLGDRASEDKLYGMLRGKKPTAKQLSSIR